MGNTTQVGHIQNNKILFLKDKYMKSFGNVKIYEVKHFNKQIVGIPCQLSLSDPQKRIDIKHPNFVNALAFEHQYKEVFGLSNSNLIYFFEYVDISLQQVLTQRISQNSRFPEGDIIRIATEILNCLAFLQQHDIAIGNIEPCTIFHDTNENCIKMYDTSLILGEYPVYNMIKNFYQDRTPYYTPESIYAYKFKDEKVLEKFKFQSDIFSLGLTLLELCSFQDSINLFDTDRKKINTVEIDNRLQQIRTIYSHKLESVIRSMLTVDPRNRPFAQQLLTQLHSSSLQPSITPTPFQNNQSGLQIPTQPSNISFNQISYVSSSPLQRQNQHTRSVSPISPSITQRQTRFEISPLRPPCITANSSRQTTPVHAKNHPSFTKLDNSTNNNSFIENTSSNNQSFYNNNSSYLKQPLPQTYSRGVSPNVQNQNIVSQAPQSKVRFDLRSKSPSQYQNIQHPIHSKSQNVSPIRATNVPQMIPVNSNMSNREPASKSNLSFASILQNHQELVNNYQSQGKEQSVLISNNSDKDSESKQSGQTLADRTNYFSQKSNIVSTPSPFAKNNQNHSQQKNNTSISNNSNLQYQQQNPSYYFYQQQSQSIISKENATNFHKKQQNSSSFLSSNANNQSSKRFYQNIQNNDSSFLNENNYSLHQYPQQQKTQMPSPVVQKIIQPISSTLKNPIPKITIITSPQQRSISPVIRTVNKSPLILPPQMQINPVIPSVISNFNSPIHKLNSIKIQPYIQSPQGTEIIYQQIQKQNDQVVLSQFNDQENQEKHIKIKDFLQPVINEESDQQSVTSFSHPQQFIQKPLTQQGNDKNEYSERYTFNELRSTPSNSDQQQPISFNANPESNYSTIDEVQNKLRQQEKNNSNELNYQLNPSQYNDYINFGKSDPELTAMASPTAQAININFNNNQQLYGQSQNQNKNDNQNDNQSNYNPYPNLNNYQNILIQGNQIDYDNNQMNLNDQKKKDIDSTVMRIQNKINQMGDLDERLQSLLQRNQKFSQYE